MITKYVKDYPFSNSVMNKLLANDIQTLDQLLKLSEFELRDIKGLGIGCISNIKQVLADNGLVIGDLRGDFMVNKQKSNPSIPAQKKIKKLSKAELSEKTRQRNKVIYDAIQQGASISSQCHKYNLSVAGLQGALRAYKKSITKNSH